MNNVQGEYFWAAGFVALATAFTPLSLAIKIFFLMGIACMATFANLAAALRPQPTPAA
jgi:hypothetical protein